MIQITKLGTAEILFLLLILSMFVTISIPQNFFNSFTSHIPILTLIVFSISAIVTLINFKHGQKQQTTDCYRSKLDKLQNINKLFMKNEDLNNLYSEMYFQEITNHNGRNNQKEYLVSNIIFITISEIYMCDSNELSDLNNSDEFLLIFKTWMKSPTLKKQWSIQKNYFNIDVINFINSLII